MVVFTVSGRGDRLAEACCEQTLALAWLWQCQSKRAEARQLLTPIYH